MSYREPFPRPAVDRWLRARLKEVRDTGTGQLLSIRGRRQSGKSTTIEHFAETSGIPYVYATGHYRMPESAQLQAATEAIRASRTPLTVDLPGTPNSWREWLSQVALAASDGPVIAVLDEFPWIAAGDRAGLEGLLQVMWDRVLEKLPVLLVLIGSDLAMMERLAQHDRPLFGRVRELVMPAMNPAEVASALPGAAAFDVFEAYLITGGYPRLVTSLHRSGLTAREWVRESFMDDLSPLSAMGQLTLSAEFPDSDAVYRVLSAIGASEPARLGLGEITSTIADPGALSKTVETAALRSLHLLTDQKRLIERELPAWASSTRLRRYRITDPYLRFWFRYVERHIDVIGRGRGDVAFAAFERDWPSWRGRTVEPVVRRSVELLGATDDRMGGIESALPWWSRDSQVEVDVVGANRERTTLVGTIKWRESGGVSRREIADLTVLRTRVPRAVDALLVAISPNGEAPVETDLSLSAADLLAAWQP